MRRNSFFTMVAFLILGMAGNGLHAQDQDDFQKWLKKDEQSFQKFVEEEDRAFADFLKRDWQVFSTRQGARAFKKPKPITVPTAPKKSMPQPVVTERKPVPLPPAPPKPKPIAPKPPAEIPSIKTVSFTYYSQQVVLPVQKKIKLSLNVPLNNHQIANAWLTLAGQNQSPLLQQLRSYHKNLALNDWGFVKLVHQAACQLSANGPMTCTLYTWFLLNKLGYNAKIAFKNDKIFLLLPSSDVMYERPFVLINQQKFYFITFKGTPDLKGKILTYRGSYKNAEKPLALAIRRLPHLPQTVEKRLVRFEYNGKSYAVPLQFDGEVVRYFKNYPQTELKLYFQAPASSFLKYSLLNQLRRLIRDKNEWQAANILLRFVQTGFKYQTDEQQFGHEKYMLPDETVYYPSCDCEDRAVLFAYLVRHLLGLEVIGLDYPNHVATAVRFHSEIPGKTLVYQGKRFVVCDPTYINADVGMVMPEFKNESPKIIAF